MKKVLLEKLSEEQIKQVKDLPLYSYTFLELRDLFKKEGWSCSESFADEEKKTVNAFFSKDDINFCVRTFYNDFFGWDFHACCVNDVFLGEDFNEARDTGKGLIELWKKHRDLMDLFKCLVEKTKEPLFFQNGKWNSGMRSANTWRDMWNIQYDEVDYCIMKHWNSYRDPMFCGRIKNRNRTPKN